MRPDAADPAPSRPRPQVPWLCPGPPALPGLCPDSAFRAQDRRSLAGTQAVRARDPGAPLPPLLSSHSLLALGRRSRHAVPTSCHVTSTSRSHITFSRHVPTSHSLVTFSRHVHRETRPGVVRVSAVLGTFTRELPAPVAVPGSVLTAAGGSPGGSGSQPGVTRILHNHGGLSGRQQHVCHHRPKSSRVGPLAGAPEHAALLGPALGVPPGPSLPRRPGARLTACYTVGPRLSVGSQMETP